MKTIAKFCSKRLILTIISLVLICSTLAGLYSCAVKVSAKDLMSDIKSGHPALRQIDDKFINNTADFSIELFQRSFTDKSNTLVSPLSVLLALSMTANGADGETLAEMEDVLGGGMGLLELNEYLRTYTNSLKSSKDSKLEIANSIWFRELEGFTVRKEFLQANADYYNAAAYGTPFDEETLKDINNWGKMKTDGMIDQILKEIPTDAMMYLINAVAFDAKWEEKYKKSDVRDWTFNNIDSTQSKVQMMNSTEEKYIETDDAVGFIKPYKNGDYSFVALKPKSSLPELIDSLDGKYFIDAVNKTQIIEVKAGIPKFTAEYENELNDELQDMGIKKAFDKYGNAEFGGISVDTPLYISKVFHKTYISVDENGTKAAAITLIQMNKETAVEASKTVILDSPFVYAIIDNATGLPIFIGTITDL